MPEPAFLDVRALTKSFRLGGPRLPFMPARPDAFMRAVDEVSFQVARGTTFGLVGESGSGKSTLGRMLVGLLAADSGSVCISGTDIVAKGGAANPPTGRLQMVFQDPYSSLNPRWRIRDILAEPMRRRAPAAGGPPAKPALAGEVAALLESVGLAAADGEKFPHMFSGGQRQRIAIARALASTPDLLVCDEPTSSLDVSVQAQILNLLKQLQAERDLTLIFISHDLAVVSYMADEIGVMHQGRLVELAPADRLFNAPAHAYTQMLLSSLPSLPVA